MRTTLDIAEDVLEAAKERARRENKTAGEVISELARAALTAPQPASLKAHEPRSHYGIRPFPKRGNAVVTNELVNKLREGDAY
ncbi:MAG TPA: hypothetical protein VMK12_32295 [Anaeromyxobacteraceae bacterium]|nr:hypothetical protein [Anaeromyxobacteraceae bacterium]